MLKALISLGVFFIAILMISTVTAVPQVNSGPLMDKFLGFSPDFDSKGIIDLILALIQFLMSIVQGLIDFVLNLFNIVDLITQLVAMIELLFELISNLIDAILDIFNPRVI